MGLWKIPIIEFGLVDHVSVFTFKNSPTLQRLGRVGGKREKTEEKGGEKITRQ